MTVNQRMHVNPGAVWYVGSTLLPVAPQFPAVTHSIHHAQGGSAYFVSLSHGSLNPWA